MNALRTLFLKYTYPRRFWYFMERVPPFFFATFSKKGLGSKGGRQLVLGKARRIFICMIPPLARKLQKHYGLQGGCTSCGASCNLLFRCPHWIEETHLCSVYEDRPDVCKLFPITPGDIKDRDLIAKPGVDCGFKFDAFKDPKSGN